MCAILWHFKISITLETPKVPRNWKSSCACPKSDWDFVVGFNALTVCTLKALQCLKLFFAALKLLRFAVGIESVCCENEEQSALQTALLPLLQQDYGLLLVQSFWSCVKDERASQLVGCLAGETRSAAALLAGLCTNSLVCIFLPFINFISFTFQLPCWGCISLYWNPYLSIRSHEMSLVEISVTSVHW